jgi:hypothetical protein
MGWQRRRCNGMGHELLASVAIQKKDATMPSSASRVVFEHHSIIHHLLLLPSLKNHLIGLLLAHTHLLVSICTREHEDYITKIRGAASPL